MLFRQGQIAPGSTVPSATLTLDITSADWTGQPERRLLSVQFTAVPEPRSAAMLVAGDADAGRPGASHTPPRLSPPR